MRIKILHSFWDFNINPISYDIIWFLCAVDHYAINNSYDGFKIHFIPEVDEPNRKYPEQFDKIIDLESRRFRKRNICYQSLSLFKNCKGFPTISIFAKRARKMVLKLASLRESGKDLRYAFK